MRHEFKIAKGIEWEGQGEEEEEGREEEEVEEKK